MEPFSEDRMELLSRKPRAYLQSSPRLVHMALCRLFLKAGGANS